MDWKYVLHVRGRGGGGGIGLGERVGSPVTTLILDIMTGLLLSKTKKNQKLGEYKNIRK